MAHSEISSKFSVFHANFDYISEFLIDILRLTSKVQFRRYILTLAITNPEIAKVTIYDAAQNWKLTG